jgi:hypothetical protein
VAAEAVARDAGVVQALVVWQLSQVLELGRWLRDLPVAVVPLWQLKQPEVTPLWSKEEVNQLWVL